MRYRSDAHTVPYSGTWRAYDLMLSTYGGTNPYSFSLVDIESHIWDDPTGSRTAFKPCTHLSYVVDSLSPIWDSYDSGDLSNHPNPRSRYEGTPFDYDKCNFHRPSSSAALAESYISVHSNSSNDIANCIFNAYNRYITGVTALDASVSIAEAGETPRLFQLWQRRRSVQANIVNGFLSYSFGWKPLISDLMAVAKELRTFPQTVRRRLKQIGDGTITRHYSFSLSETVDDRQGNHAYFDRGPLPWQKYVVAYDTVAKSRVVGVTIRANVKPKLGPEGQAILNKLGALGLIPSLATVWSVTRLSFVVDWFYNIGAAIENLQGCLTHDITNVEVCVTDLRTRSVRTRGTGTGGHLSHTFGVEQQKAFFRYPAAVPSMPSLRYPRRAMPYVLLGLLGVTQTKAGRYAMQWLDNTKVSKAIQAKVARSLDALSPRKRAELVRQYSKVIPGASSRDASWWP